MSNDITIIYLLNDKLKYILLRFNFIDTIVICNCIL